MSKLKRFVWAALSMTIAIGPAGCARHLAPRPEAQITQLVDRFIASVNAADTNAFVAFFTDDATAFLPTNAARKSGAQSIREAVAPVFSQGPRSTPAHADDLQIAVSGQLAVASFDAGSGAQHARRTLVLKNVDGEWKVIHLHASNVVQAN